MNKYAVLIGNSQFPDESDKAKLPDLACPELDVDGLLASERGEFEVLALNKLQDVVNQTKQEDLLLIYYSRHGKPNDAGQLYLTIYTFSLVKNVRLTCQRVGMKKISAGGCWYLCNCLKYKHNCISALFKIKTNY